MYGPPVYRSLILDEIDMITAHVQCCYFKDAATGATWSHQQLRNEATQMSKKVRSILNPIQPKCCPPVVGVLGHASCQVVLSVLSILEASAAFILLDPRLPTLRLMAMLDQATVSFVINTTDQVLINANISGRPSIQILSLSELRSLPECDEIRNQVSKGDGVGGGTSHPHLPFSHLIFTSGSTGRPMIVKGSEEGLINRARWMRDAKLIDRQSIIAMKTSVSFVDAITELFLPLLVPCSAVCLDPSLVLSPSSLSKILETHSITHYISTPSLLKLWDDTDDSVQSLKSLKVLTSSGEPLSWPLARKLRRVLPTGCKILNIYGSAEVSADCSVFELPSDPEDQWMGHAFVPVGRPLSNCQIRIRNSFQGEGEVMVSGLCLSHGYLEDENMESQRFVVLDPGRPSSCRWFASGDLGKIDSQGNLHIIGRLDNTFKVHGARVSLEEVESCLGGAPGIDLVACCLTDSSSSSHRPSHQSFIAYYQSASHVDPSVVRRYASEHLPSHAIPSHFILIAELPKTLGGKVDRKSLHLLSTSLSTHEDHSPIMISETLISRLIFDLMGVAIEPTQDLFEAGMSSIMAIELASKLKTEPALVYVACTIRRLATLLSNKDTSSETEPQSKRQKRVNLSEVEGRLVQIRAKPSASGLTSSRDYSWLGSSGNFWSLTSAGFASGCCSTKSTSSPLHENTYQPSIFVSVSIPLDKCVDAPPLLVSSLSELESLSVVIASSHAGTVVCVDSATGDELWRTQLHDRADVGCCLCMTEGPPLIAAVVGDSHVVFLSLATGDLVATSPAVPGGVRATPRALGSCVWLTTHNAQLVSLSVPSCQSALSEIVSRINLPAPSSCPPLLSSETEHGAHIIIVACLDGSIFSAGLGPQKVQEGVMVDKNWVARSSKGPIFSAPLIMMNSHGQQSYMVVAHVTGIIKSLSIKDGNEFWSCDLNQQIFADLVQLRVQGAELVLVATHPGLLFCLDSSNGSAVWTVDLSIYGQISNAPAPNGSLLLTASNSGTVVVLRLQEGGSDQQPHVLALASLPSDCFCSPVFHKQDIWVGCRDDNLFKLKLS